MTEIIKKIPGFRSGSLWKGAVASVIYLFGLLILLVILFPGVPTLALEKIEPTNRSSITISGKTLANKSVFLLKDGEQLQSETSDSKGQFLFPLNNLTEGDYSYTVKVCSSEKQDKCRTENALVIVDQTSPVKPIIAMPEVLPEDSETKITITGVTEPNSKIIAFLDDNNSSEAVSNDQGDFAIETGLAVGGNTITVKSIDAVGNESEPVVSNLTFNPKKYTAKVERAVDGDTVKLESGEVVRYIGIDTPETVDPRKPVQCFGKEASAKNKELVEGKEIRLEKDISETDKYGRLLRYVWLDDVLINELLVREGYAQSSSYPPDVKYQDRFLEAQGLARDENKGLWGDACNTTTQSTAPVVPNTYTAPVIQTQPVQKPAQTSGSYTCNCSKTCVQMSSCDEAQYQLNVCSCKARDADGDGIACDSDCQ